nr:MAG TPA: hypothetical protein [Caudoviricetes sp.]
MPFFLITHILYNTFVKKATVFLRFFELFLESILACLV